MTSNTILPKPSLIGAVLWMLGAVASLLLMALAGRELMGEVSLFEVMFFRNALCLLALAPIVWPRWREVMATRRWRAHGGRNIVHFAAQGLWLYGLAYLPLAEVIALEFTAPVWTAVLAAIFIAERLTRMRGFGVVLGFAGIWIILRPGVEIIHPAAFAVLASAIGFATTFVVTKSMTTSERPLTILVYMNLVQLPLSAAPALYDWVTPSISLWPWVAAIGLAGLGSHYCFTKAFQRADAGFAAPIDFVRLPLSVLVGYLLYQEPLDVFVAFGAVAIIAGNLLNLRGLNLRGLNLRGRPRDGR